MGRLMTHVVVNLFLHTYKKFYFEDHTMLCCCAAYMVYFRCEEEVTIRSRECRTIFGGPKLSGHPTL
jgi:hypothetical protein